MLDCFKHQLQLKLLIRHAQEVTVVEEEKADSFAFYFNSIFNDTRYKDSEPIKL